jgi:hypothetical protein
VRVGSGRGFTIVESLIAALLLSLGILALVGSAALASRMVGRGGVSTRAAFAAASRMEWLRRVAASSVPACTSPEWRSGSAGGPGLAESWELLDPGLQVQQVRLVVRVRHPTGTSVDTIVTGFLC